MSIKYIISIALENGVFCKADLFFLTPIVPDACNHKPVQAAMEGCL